MLRVEKLPGAASVGGLFHFKLTHYRHTVQDGYCKPYRGY